MDELFSDIPGIRFQDPWEEWAEQLENLEEGTLEPYPGVMELVLPKDMVDPLDGEGMDASEGVQEIQGMEEVQKLSEVSSPQGSPEEHSEGEKPKEGEPLIWTGRKGRAMGGRPRRRPRETRIRLMEECPIRGWVHYSECFECPAYDPGSLITCKLKEDHGQDGD